MHAIAQMPTPTSGSKAGKAGKVGVLHPNLYLWLVFFGAMDVILTRVILFFGGIEVNPLANEVIKAFGVPGMSVFKFSIIAMVILICEYIGRIRPRTGRGLAFVSVMISMAPIAWSCVLLTRMALTGGPPPMEMYPGDNEQGISASL